MQELPQKFNRYRGLPQSRYKRLPPGKDASMAIPKTAKKELYSEAEAAEALSISVARLRQLLDEHIFNDGRPRPDSLEFRLSDIILLDFWNRSTPNAKIVRMPRRA